MTWNKPGGKPLRLTYRLLLYVILVSLGLTLGATGLQLYSTYKSDLRTLDKNFEFIRQSYIPPLTSSLYKLDHEQLALELDGILRLQDMVYAEVTEDEGKTFKLAKGKPQARRDRVLEYRLDYRAPTGVVLPIGTLRVAANLDGVYQRLLNSALIILAINGLQTFLAALCLLALFQWLVTRHLHALARYAENFSLDELDQELRLNRKSRPDKPDEFDHVARALNNMRQRLAQDMALRAEAEEKLKDSLTEKDVLLKEINHRVKNNMQVIVSLLSLQSAKMDDPEFKAMFKDSQNRVRSMAMVHERLYTTGDFNRMNLGQYVKSLYMELSRAYVDQPGRINFDIKPGELALPLDKAVPLGLIVNELVTNCLKHAFPEGQSGSIVFELSKDDRGRGMIIISDNGVGLGEDTNLNQNGSMGMMLIDALVRQIGGQINFEHDHGMRAVVEFPLE